MDKPIKLIVDKGFFYVSREQFNKLNLTQKDYTLYEGDYYIFRDYNSFSYVISYLRGYSDNPTLMPNEFLRNKVDYDMKLLNQTTQMTEIIKEIGDHDMKLLNQSVSVTDVNNEIEEYDPLDGGNMDEFDTPETISIIENLKNISKLFNTLSPNDMSNTHVPSFSQLMMALSHGSVDHKLNDNYNKECDSDNDNIDVKTLITEIDQNGVTEKTGDLSFDKLSTDTNVNAMIYHFMSSIDTDSSDADSIGFDQSEEINEIDQTKTNYFNYDD